MLTVSNLIEILKKQPRDALVVIENDVVIGVDLQTGKLRDGYYNPEFRENPKGKIKALRFTKRTELSTGEVVESVI